MQYFGVKNWSRHQHYKDRSPPWIKLYNDLLDDYDFTQLPDVSRAHLIAIWLLASRTNNRLPYDAAWLQTATKSTDPINLDRLTEAGFIVLEQDCSKPLATRYQDARPEREGEGEGETEQRQKVVAARPSAKKGTRWDGRPVPKTWVDWAVVDLGMTPAAASEAALSFVDYWTGVSGARGVKLNWEGTWRNWCRKDVKDGKRSNGRDDAATRALLSA